MISPKIHAGNVVHSMCRIWSNRLERAATGARFVVSEKGDNLSPKYAPVIMAPAAGPFGIPKPSAIPIKAIPMVPTVPQEVPVKSDTKLETIQAVNKK